MYHLECLQDIFMVYTQCLLNVHSSWASNSPGAHLFITLDSGWCRPQLPSWAGDPGGYPIHPSIHPSILPSFHLWLVYDKIIISCWKWHCFMNSHALVFAIVVCECSLCQCEKTLLLQGPEYRSWPAGWKIDVLLRDGNHPVFFRVFNV